MVLRDRNQHAATGALRGKFLKHSAIDSPASLAGIGSASRWQLRHRPAGASAEAVPPQHALSHHLKTRNARNVFQRLGCPIVSISKKVFPG